MSRFQLVVDNFDHFADRGGVKRLCVLVEVKRSSFYLWLHRAPAKAERSMVDAELAERIRADHVAQRDPAGRLDRW